MTMNEDLLIIQYQKVTQLKKVFYVAVFHYYLINTLQHGKLLKPNCIVAYFLE